MNDEAAHLVDHDLPQVTGRQWVLSFSYKLRFRMAHNLKLTNKILKIFTFVISSYYKKKAREYGIKKSQVGAVSLIKHCFYSAVPSSLYRLAGFNSSFKAILEKL